MELWLIGFVGYIDFVLSRSRTSYLGPTDFTRLLDLFSNDEWRDELRNFAPLATYKPLCVQPLMTAGLRNVPFPT